MTARFTITNPDQNEQVIVVPGAVTHIIDRLFNEHGDLLGTLELDRSTCTVRFVPATADEVRAERANWSSRGSK